MIKVGEWSEGISCYCVMGTALWFTFRYDTIITQEKMLSVIGITQEVLSHKYHIEGSYTSLLLHRLVLSYCSFSLDESFRSVLKTAGRSS